MAVIGKAGGQDPMPGMTCRLPPPRRLNPLRNRISPSVATKVEIFAGSAIFHPLAVKESAVTRNSKETARNVAEERFEKAQKTTREAKAQIDAEGKARREKTTRLKALRMAKDAEDAVSKETEQKAKAAAKTKPVRKSTKKTAVSE
jgi:hypothetical protein